MGRSEVPSIRGWKLRTIRKKKLEKKGSKSRTAHSRKASAGGPLQGPSPRRGKTRPESFKGVWSGGRKRIDCLPIHWEKRSMREGEERDKLKMRNGGISPG